MTSAPIPIVIDSREQLPYLFPPAQVASTVAALPAGDYSLVGYETRVAIERKSLADYVGSLTAGRERFLRELQKLQAYELAAVVVEASFGDLVDGNYRSRATASSIVGSTFAITARHCPVLFAGNRALAARMTFELLRRFWIDAQVRARCARGNA